MQRETEVTGKSVARFEEPSLRSLVLTKTLHSRIELFLLSERVTNLTNITYVQMLQIAIINWLEINNEYAHLIPKDDSFEELIRCYTDICKLYPGYEIWLTTDEENTDSKFSFLFVYFYHEISKKCHIELDKIYSISDKNKRLLFMQLADFAHKYGIRTIFEDDSLEQWFDVEFMKEQLFELDKVEDAESIDEIKSAIIEKNKFDKGYYNKHLNTFKSIEDTMKLMEKCKLLDELRPLVDCMLSIQQDDKRFQLYANTPFRDEEVMPIVPEYYIGFVNNNESYLTAKLDQFINDSYNAGGMEVSLNRAYGPYFSNVNVDKFPYHLMNYLYILELQLNLC